MKNIIKCIRLVLPISPLRMILYMLLSLPKAILPAVLLYLQQKIVDDVTNFSQGLSLTYYRKWVLLLIGTYMILKMFELISNQYMEFGYFRYIFIGLDAQIHYKSAEIPLEYYDNAEYYQIVQNAKNASMFLVFTANLAILSFLLFCNLATVGGYLTTLNPVLIIFVILVSVPTVVEKLQSANWQSSFMKDTVQATRRKEYAVSLLSSYDRKKELSHYGACHYIQDKYLAACKEIDSREWKHIRQINKIGLLFAGIKTLFHGMAIFLMIWLLVTGGITIGGFSVLLTSFGVLTNVFTQLFDYTGEILQTSVMSTAFFDFMNLEIKDGTLDWKEKQVFARLEQVSYRYPNAEKDALKDISLSVKKGEKIAIVGENGAGKTTLAKLLSGFLQPTEGVMELGGVLRDQIQERSIFEQISAVYQEYGRYKLTLAENVSLGDIKKERNSLKVYSALNWAGISLTDCPEEMMLGKEFGGTELSGGQWQRLAMARSYYRQRPILFLDEPTAAIDPLEETALYEKLNELAKNKTVILVTHRLGAIKNVDTIYVLENGRITESGSFQQLLQQKGHFYHIWKEQVKWYQKNENI